MTGLFVPVCTLVHQMIMAIKSNDTELSRQIFGRDTFLTEAINGAHTVSLADRGAIGVGIEGGLARFWCTTYVPTSTAEGALALHVIIHVVTKP
jgi:non-canonical (house-cleaning) NTP pyrophosphatase